MKVKLTKLFNWDIKNVYPVRVTMKDGAIDAYTVTVEYIYHGRRDIVIRPSDAGSYRLYPDARAAAAAVYSDYWELMRRQRTSQQQ